MNVTKNHIIIFIAFVILCIAACFLSFYVGKNRGYNTGVGEYTDRARELVNRIAEYERREEARNRREAEFIRRERERTERTENQLAALRGLDRRSGSLLQDLREEIGILESDRRNSCDLFSDYFNNLGSE